MAKFRVRLSFEKFELEVEGSREDVPMIAHNLGQQVAGILAPAAHIVEGEVVELGNSSSAPIVQEENGAAPRRRGGRKRASNGAAASNGAKDGASKTAALDWRHSQEKWGVPSQEWTTANKAIWLLYVAKEETNQGELSTTQIVNTFNKHFKQAKQVFRANVHRDLGSAKLGAAAFVGEDTVSNPHRWYLTENGRREAERLITSAKTPVESA